MGVIIRCASCGQNYRFKGKKSELGRGIKIKCACGEKTEISKKPNGKFVCQAAGNNH